MGRPLVLFGIIAIVVPPLIAATTVTPATQPASAPATTAASKPKEIPQDGPGLYRASAGPGGKFTATFRAKSREDAISIALKTVAQKAMDFDENVNIGELKVVRLGD